MPCATLCSISAVRIVFPSQPLAGEWRAGSNTARLAHEAQPLTDQFRALCASDTHSRQGLTVLETCKSRTASDIVKNSTKRSNYCFQLEFVSRMPGLIGGRPVVTQRIRVALVLFVAAVWGLSSVR